MSGVGTKRKVSVHRDSTSDAIAASTGWSASGSSQRSSSELLESDIPPWLLRHRITVPNKAPGNFHRRNLVERCTLDRQRVTLLMAPGGFGKTTLLAECARDAVDRNTPTAWLSMGEQKEPAQLEDYLVYAFGMAGLDVLHLFRSVSTEALQTHSRIDLLIRAVEAYGKPCVLALDEVERVKDARSVAILNSLIRGGPPGLHVAISCRELPVGLDVAASVLGGDAVVLTADDLRFSKPEIARFFDLTLSRQELTEVEEASLGWPIALQIRRNAHGLATNGESRTFRHVIENWMESRLWYSFSNEDRDLLLDVGLFDWFDAELLDAVLENPGVIGRLESMAGLAGLMQPPSGGRAYSRCLHPLVKEQCARQLQRHAPERYKSINRRIAMALSKRGDVVAAVQHAARAADMALLRGIFADAGGVRLMLREGVDRLLTIDAILTEELIAPSPRLSFARAVCLIYRGRLAEARRLYEAAARGLSSRGLDNDREVRIDQLFTRAMLAYFGCESATALESLIRFAEWLGLGEETSVDPAIGNMVTFGLCYVHNLKAEFESGEIYANRLRKGTHHRAPYLTAVSGFLAGEVAMAQGRVRDATGEYDAILRHAKERSPGDPRLEVWRNVLLRELDLECNRFDDEAEAIRLVTALRRLGGQFSTFAAAAEMGAELVLTTRGAADAVSMIEEILDHAHRAELPSLARYLAVLRVSILAVSGRVDEATRSWRARGLAIDDASCLELRGQSWREMEAMSCARLRLDIASGCLDKGRSIGRSLIEVAASRNLRRTQMRGLALLTGLEARSGNLQAASAYLEEYLRLFAKIGYARPMVREGEGGVAALHAFRNASPNSPLAKCAESILAASLNTSVMDMPDLSARELEVLQRLETQRDKEIASTLGISSHGVRYHVRSILKKLDARDRFDAARRARSRGLLAPDN